MVLDSSALLAILMDEPERHRFSTLIATDPKRLLAAPSLVETAIVIEARHGEPGLRGRGRRAGKPVSGAARLIRPAA